MKNLVFALLAGPVALFCADEALPKAETILDRWVEVTGGRAAFEKRHNEVMHGAIEFTGRGLKGAMTVYQAEPDKNLAVIEIEGIGRIESGSNGEVAWENSPLQGPRIKEGDEKAGALRDGTFNGAINWRKIYIKAETAGSETTEGHECYKVMLTPKEGKPTTEFFDKKTGLLIKTMVTRNTPMGEITAEVLADDFRKEGDIIVPHKLINRLAGQEFEISVQSVEVNVEMPKDRFDLPPDIQALLKKSREAPRPAAAATTAPAGNSGKLNIFMAGKPMASETYTVQKGDGKISVSGSGNATIGPMKIDIEQFSVTTDEKYQPLEAVAKAKLGQVQMNVKTTFADGKAKNEIDNGQGPKVKEDTVSANALVVNANLPLYPWSFLAMRANLNSQEPQQFPVYVIGQAEVTATVVFKGRESVEFAGKTAELNHINMTAQTPQGQPIALDFWLDDNRKVIKIAVPSQGVEAYQDGFDRKAPPEPAKPETPKPDSGKSESKAADKPAKP
jgi:hypothetical protein